MTATGTRLGLGAIASRQDASQNCGSLARKTLCYMETRGPQAVQDVMHKGNLVRENCRTCSFGRDCLVLAATCSLKVPPRIARPGWILLRCGARWQRYEAGMKQ